jgi:hypothetical protein
VFYLNNLQNIGLWSTFHNEYITSHLEDRAAPYIRSSFVSLRTEPVVLQETVFLPTYIEWMGVCIELAAMLRMTVSNFELGCVPVGLWATAG